MFAWWKTCGMNFFTALEAMPAINQILFLNFLHVYILGLYYGTYFPNFATEYWLLELLVGSPFQTSSC